MKQEAELCDRQNLFEGEQLIQQQNHTYEYKFFAKYSCNAQTNQLSLLKTICGMLNGFGGYIFLGVREDQSNSNIRRIVIGYRLNEWDKEQYKKYVNMLAKRFYPRVDTAEMDVYVKFVPVVTVNDRKFVIKIVVRRGLNNYFYSFKHRYPELDSDVNLFYRRRDCQTIQVTDMAEIYQQILRRKQLKVTERGPIQTSKITESGYWISRKREQMEKVEVRKQQLDQSQICDVMPQEFDSSQSSPSTEVHVDPMLKNYKKTVIENIPIGKQDQFKKMLKKFKRQSVQIVPGREEVSYIVKFSTYSQHLRFAQHLTLCPLPDTDITYRTE